MIYDVYTEGLSWLGLRYTCNADGIDLSTNVSRSASYDRNMNCPPCHEVHIPCLRYFSPLLLRLPYLAAAKFLPNVVSTLYPRGYFSFLELFPHAKNSAPAAKLRTSSCIRICSSLRREMPLRAPIPGRVLKQMAPLCRISGDRVLGLCEPCSSAYWC